MEPHDLIEYGIIPEFVGRFNSIANCNELTEEDLIEILTKPRNAIIKQYIQLFKDEDVVLEFTQEALNAIAKKAKQSKTGARALRMIVENILKDLMFETPTDKSIKKIIIEKDTVDKNQTPKIIKE